MLTTTINVTGSAGPGIAVTSLAFTDVTAFQYDTQNEILNINQGTKVTPIAIPTATTFTVTISGSTVTVTIS